MGGLGGITGAAPALWCTLRGLERDAQRAVVQNFNLLGLDAARFRQVVLVVVVVALASAAMIVASFRAP